MLPNESAGGDLLERYSLKRRASYLRNRDASAIRRNHAGPKLTNGGKLTGCASGGAVARILKLRLDPSTCSAQLPAAY